MIVLHGLWSPGAGLRVWGEVAGSLDAGPAGRRRPRRRPRRHPFACPVELLLEALGGDSERTGECVVLLPSSPRAPAPSPELARAGETVPEEVDQLAPWLVPAGTLAPAAALDLLLALESARSAEVSTGASLDYLGEVAKFALELTARGRVVPGLERLGTAFYAIWRPLLSDHRDAGRLALLERTMPGACRAMVPEGAEPSAEAAPSPLTILEHALGALTDACVRGALAGGPLSRRPLRTPPPAGAWLAALAAADGRLTGEQAGLPELKERLDGWLAPATADSAAAFRTCFRLSPPDDGPRPRPWHLEFLLQAADDPSLLVPAGQVWKARGRALTLLRRRLEDPQERLLGDLGRALNLFPGLEPALRAPHPTGLELDASGAYAFLREAAPLLEQAGFGVLVPPWWKAPGARLGLKLRARPRGQATTSSSGLLGLEEICDYEWQLALGDEAISQADFRALARLKVPLVQVRGQWVELRPDDVEAALRLFEAREAPRELSTLDVLRIAAGAAAPPAGLPVVGVEAEGWLAGLLGADARLEPLDTPTAFQGVLRPYQQRGLSWLAFLDGLGLGACLADDMGLGKTIQLLALLLLEQATRTGLAPPRPTLLVCPMSVVGNWQREASRFAPSLRVHVHHGAERLGGAEFREAVQACDLVVTTYALVARDRESLEAVEWGRVVLDEAQNIKNSAARQSQAVRALRAPRRTALTGTPVENRLAELWSIMEFLNPGLLGSSREFRDRFATPIERYRDDRRADQLKRLTGPFLLRRVKTDRTIIHDLPEKQEMKAYCNLTREQASLYQAVVDDMLQRIESSDGIQRRGLILSTMMKLKQVCNHPAQLLQDRSELSGRSGKLALLEETLEDALAVGDRALVFTQFAEMGELLHAHLRQRFAREALFLHGGTSRKARDEMVARFQAETGPSIFILSLKAGGTGLNLTAANQVIHFDRWWNPAVEDQATDRAFRIGQTRNVQVRKFICVGTLEERIDLMIDSKKALAERIVGTGEAWLTEMSTSELREIVRLSADAVAE